MKKELVKKPINKGAGHRKRLRDRFLQSGFNGFLDYEILELLLTLKTPQRDCKQTAKEALKKFGSLNEVLDTSREELEKVKNIGPANTFILKLFPAVWERLAKEKLPEKIELGSSLVVANYLKKLIGHDKKENFVLLSLDSRNCLIKISHISTGSLNASIVHPREVFKEAIQVSAAQIIIAHNHPSGNLEPSEEDIRVTKRLSEAGKIFGIELLDHIIVSKDTHQSLREAGLL